MIPMLNSPSKINFDGRPAVKKKNNTPDERKGETAPLEVPILKGDDPWTGRLLPLPLAFVAFGLIARLVRYLVCYPICPDESFLAVNFLSGGYGDLLGALRYHQVAPLLFLWAEMFTVKLLGFSEYTLRLFPFLCDLGSVLLFYRLSRGIVRGDTSPSGNGFLRGGVLPDPARYRNKALLGGSGGLPAAVGALR